MTTPEVEAQEEETLDIVLEGWVKPQWGGWAGGWDPSRVG